MSDELECFKKAIELGCPDFEIDRDLVCLRAADYGRYDNYPDESIGPAHPLPSKIKSYDAIGKRINRYAAAVCAEWWNSAEMHTLAEPMRMAMIDAARAFGRKYGQ